MFFLPLFRESIIVRMTKGVGISLRRSESDFYFALHKQALCKFVNPAVCIDCPHIFAARKRFVEIVFARSGGVEWMGKRRVEVEEEALPLVWLRDGSEKKVKLGLWAVRVCASAPEVIYNRLLHHLPPTRAPRVFFHKFSSLFRISYTRPPPPQFSFSSSASLRAVCEGDVIFPWCFSLLCLDAGVRVSVCVEEMPLKTRYRFRRGVGGWQRKCQGVGGHVGASLLHFFHPRPANVFHATARREKFKLLIPGSYSDGWWWFLLPAENHQIGKWILINSIPQTSWHLLSAEPSLHLLVCFQISANRLSRMIRCKRCATSHHP